MRLTDVLTYVHFGTFVFRFRRDVRARAFVKNHDTFFLLNYATELWPSE